MLDGSGGALPPPGLHVFPVAERSVNAKRTPALEALECLSLLSQSIDSPMLCTRIQEIPRERSRMAGVHACFLAGRFVHARQLVTASFGACQGRASGLHLDTLRAVPTWLACTLRLFFV